MVIFKPTVRRTGKYVRTRKEAPSHFSEMRTLKVGDSRIVRGRDGADWRTQSVLIPKKKWNKPAAKKLLKQQFGAKRATKIEHDRILHE
jgi:hypothetical protein